ncbi:MAG: hypothetical protein ABWY50_09285 [Aeromicrobium sp.]
MLSLPLATDTTRLQRADTGRGRRDIAADATSDAEAVSGPNCRSAAG